MKPFQALPAAVLPLIVLVGLVSCSQENTNNEQAVTELQTADLSNVSDTLIAIPKPNPAAMDPKVADVVVNAWIELETQVANPSLSKAARAQAYVDYGLVSFGNGFALPAEMAFENAVQLMPDEARWVYFLALMHEYSGNLAKAEARFSRVLDLLPNDLPALLRLGDVYFEQARMMDAQQNFQEVLKLDGQNARAHYGLGLIFSAQDKNLEALAQFENALKLQPEANRTNYFLGMTWRNLGDRDKARAFLEKHGPIEPSFSDPLFDEVSGGQSRISGLWAHMNAGSQAFVEGNYTKAVVEFRLATLDLPDDPRAWQSLGMALNKDDDREGAKLAYIKALTLSEDSAVIHHELATLLVQGGEPNKAEEHLLLAVKKDPSMLGAHTTLASLYAQTDRMSLALERYQIALELDPQSGELVIAKSETLIALDRPADALKALEDMIRVNPNDVNVRIAYSLVLADTSKLIEAMSEIQRALADAKNDKTRSRAHYAIGQIKLRQNNANEAIASFGDALKLNSRNKGAGLELARSFLRIRDYTQALATYEVHIGLWPENDVTRVEAARVAVMLGNGSKAKSLLEEGSNNGAASSRLLGTLARLLVLSTETDVQDPTQALQYAQRALAMNQAEQHKETVALCHSALGNFAQAIKLQEQLLAEKSAITADRVRSRMEKNLGRYRSKNLGRLPFDAS